MQHLISLLFLFGGLGSFCFGAVVDERIATKPCPILLADQAHYTEAYLTDANHPVGRPYFLMNYLYGNGTFDDVTAALDDLQAMGVKTIWLSPVHEQTVMLWKNPYAALDKGEATGPYVGAALDAEEWNNHGYWVLDHYSVAEHLGGRPKLKRLSREVRKRGMQICFDAVLNHFGYPADANVKFKIGSKWVAPTDLAYFKPMRPVTRNLQIPAHMYQALTNATTPEKARAAQRALAKLPLANLISFNHENPEVRQHLIDAYKSFYDDEDIQLRVMRLDASKHFSQEYLAEFINALNAHADAHGEPITYIVEFLEYRDYTMDIFANDLIANVKDSSRVFFLDFPFARELRRLYQDGWQRTLSFRAFKGHIEYRESSRPVQRLIGSPEDHDLSLPVEDKFLDPMIYVVGEFFSYNPVVFFHGNEGGPQNRPARSHIDRIDPNGVVAQYAGATRRALVPYLSVIKTPTTTFHIADDDWLLAERRRKDASLFLLADKGHVPATREVRLSAEFAGRNFKLVAGGNGATLKARQTVTGIELFEDTAGNRVLAKLDFVQDHAGIVLKIRSTDKFFAVFELVAP